VEALVGRIAEVVEPCRPRGTVKLDGELWEAVCEAGADRGEEVVVRAVERLRLVVAPRGPEPGG
jgi:membrane protein implicated in regulation of membrane protease activity